jgi:hypothetical protein
VSEWTIGEAGVAASDVAALWKNAPAASAKNVTSIGATISAVKSILRCGTSGQMTCRLWREA